MTPIVSKIAPTILLGLLFSACAGTQFKMGSGTYRINGVAWKDEVHVNGETHKADAGRKFLEVEYVEIYDGKRLQNCCVDSSAYVVDAAGEKYPLKFTGTTIQGGPSVYVEGSPVPDVSHTLTFGPIPSDARGLVLHIEDKAYRL